MIDSAYWAAAAVGSDRLLGALLSAKKNKNVSVPHGNQLVLLSVSLYLCA
jgi:hypothetical protein